MSVEDRLAGLRAACGYSDGSDGAESDIDSLIAYKDALEDAYVLDARPDRTLDADALDAIAGTLSGTSWSPDTLETIAEYVRTSGREIADYEGGE